MSHKNHSLDRRFADSLMAAMHISSALLSAERMLATTKWFDYRFLTPMAATQRFADIFREQYKQKYAQYFDVAESEYKRGIGKDILFENAPQTITSLWTARQHADRLGVPYELFISFAMNHLMDRVYTKVPLSNQLYSEHALAAVEMRWNEFEENMLLRTVYDPRYLSEHYKSLPAQNAYIKYQLNAVRRRLKSDSNYLLAGVCFDYKTLPIDIAENELGADVVNKARSNAGYSEPIFHGDIDVTDLRPSCHSVPAAYSANSMECKECVTQEECHNAVNSVKNALVRVVGNDDPVRDRVRKQAAERQRRRRERLRSEKKDL